MSNGKIKSSNPINRGNPSSALSGRDYARRSGHGIDRLMNTIKETQRTGARKVDASAPLKAFVVYSRRITWPSLESFYGKGSPFVEYIKSLSSNNPSIMAAGVSECFVHIDEFTGILPQPDTMVLGAYSARAQESPPLTLEETIRYTQNFHRALRYPRVYAPIAKHWPVTESLITVKFYDKNNPSFGGWIVESGP